MQVLLSEKETKTWLEGKTEADAEKSRGRLEVKQVREELEATTVVLEIIREAVRRADGCHHHGTRYNCKGCTLYGGESGLRGPGQPTGLPMCAYPRQL